MVVLFPVKVLSELVGIRTSTYRRHNSTHNSQIPPPLPSTYPAFLQQVYHSSFLTWNELLFRYNHSLQVSLLVLPYFVVRKGWEYSFLGQQLPFWKLILKSSFEITGRGHLFFIIGIWPHPRQVLYHLSHVPSPFLLFKSLLRFK
jgi:hypothetical protein